MPNEILNLRRTKEVMDAIAGKVKTVKLARDGQGANEVAFQEVQQFVSLDLVAAMRAALISQNRIAVVVFANCGFETSVHGTDQVSRQRREFFVIVCDRAMGHNGLTKAMLGDGQTVGAVTLADRLLEELSGILFENPKGMTIEPLGFEELEITDKDQKNLPGRYGVAVSFSARGGQLSKPLGNGAIV